LITSSRVLFSKFDTQEIIRAIIRCSIKHGMNSIGFFLIHLFFKRRHTATRNMRTTGKGGRRTK